VARTGRSSLQGSFTRLVLASAVVVSALLGSAAPGKPSLDRPTTIALADLPKEAQQTQRLIRTGGPFPHAKDGVVFGNRERQLPRRERGYYREYTVPTPGSRDRGARRIVCGGKQALEPESCFYSDDHYASFRRIVQ